MRKLINIFIFLIMLIPIKVNADENIIIDCDSVKVKKGSTVICDVIADSYYEINGVSADIKVSSNLEFESFETNSSWQGDATGNKIGLYTSENQKGKTNLGKLLIKVKDNANPGSENISLDNCIFSNANFEKINVTSNSVELKVLSSNNRLSNLEVLPGTIDFDPEVLEYNISVDSPSINLTAVMEDEKSSLYGDTGSKSLKYGLNTFKISVTSESKDRRTYVINVTRIDPRSTENRLSKLSVGGVNINFNENIDVYNIKVDYSITSIKIDANLKDNKSSFIKGYGPTTKNLKEGLNKVEIKVAAENGITKTYTLNITRGDDPNNKSDDNSLKNLNIENSQLDFSKDQEEYKITIPYNVDSINIEAIASSNKSKIEITGNDNLQIGENIVSIKVTSANGEVKEYKIIVTKKDKESSFSSNNYLKSLKIEGYSIDFSKEKLEYNLEIQDESNLNIKALAEDNNANVSIIGNSDLENESVISIIVTAEDGSKREYKINIIKDGGVNYLYIAIAIEILVIAGVIVYFKERKKGKDQYEEL